MSQRIYLDWNAAAPLRHEAKTAMLKAMDSVGNPSSQHFEGRASRTIVDRARQAVAALATCAPEEVIFTSGATEALNTIILGPKLKGQTWSHVVASKTDHAAIRASIEALAADTHWTRTLHSGEVEWPLLDAASGVLICSTAANSETGICTYPPRFGVNLIDATQWFGKQAFLPDGTPAPKMTAAAAMAVSAHKIGGPKGVGALIFREYLGMESSSLVFGGGQEFRRRSGTENIIGIAGFGAVCEALIRDPPDWDAVRKRRDRLEKQLADAAPEVMFLRPPKNSQVARLANTALFAVPGWRADTQLIQLDLAGFAVSAGSACSSGKIATSPVVSAMGYEAEIANAAVRVSIGPDTTDDAIDQFAAAWARGYARFKARR